MNKLIACCGLDCEKCDARIATINNDNVLREKVAKRWSQLNAITITPEMINCVGCRLDGVKTVYCDSLCPIKKCVKSKNLEHCGQCLAVDECQTVEMVFKNSSDAKDNLKK